MTIPPPVPRDRPAGSPPGPNRWRAYRLCGLIVVIGLAVTAVLASASRANYRDNERRLTLLQTRLTADSLAVAPVDVERRLGRAVSLTAATGDTRTDFAGTLAASLGAAGPFSGVELFRVSGASVRPVLASGAAPLLPPTSAPVLALCRTAAGGVPLAVARFVVGRTQRVAYALAASGRAGTFVGYAESPLPTDRVVSVPADNPDSDLRVAIYFGPDADSADLVETNAGRLPLRGTTATATVPFGNAVVTLVASPRGSLAGGFARAITWGIAVVGALMTLGVALLTGRLVRRRLAAEGLAAENRRLFQDQRKVSETLQHSLLPQVLPTRPDLALAVRYLAGTAGIEVGGDWYDVIDVDERTVFFTVGDVAGKGLEAAILMASLRNAITAYATDGDAPGAVLSKIGRLVDVARDGRFATVVCGTIDLPTGRVTLANAGHPRPVLVGADHCGLVTGTVGPPVGVGPGGYPTATVDLRPGDTLLAYTDGLIERRGESLAAGLDRICGAAHYETPLERLLDDVIAELVPDGPPDDIAALGMRWQG